MVKFLKPGKVVIVLNGRFAGKKAVIVHSFEGGTPARPYGHALVAGVDRYPLKVNRDMSKKRVEKRSRMKPFVRAINYNHLMPTRYLVDVADGLKASTTPDMMTTPDKRKEARKAAKAIFEEKYKAGKHSWFFNKLRF
uniref:KOW domain-containing protein n=1 Tax=Compsopogon caeruleus TaxID=31354 RepID=A0A7S1XGF9_9RHOD|mmetsp:Transcript_5764/g.11437  ORF Transcript_5764/g.11437 Transcript_5764/m.11437 type:complete len:138 (+) Transcript_5764:171-584(+)